MWTVKIKTLNEDMVVAVLILRSSRQEYSQIFVLWKSCKITKYRFFLLAIHFWEGTPNNEILAATKPALPENTKKAT